MVRIKQVMARKDAWSVVLAIVLAMAVQPVMYISYSWASTLLKVPGNDMGYAPTSQPWQVQYGQPLLNLLIQVVAIEVFLWLVWGLGRVNKNMKPLGSSRKK